MLARKKMMFNSNQLTLRNITRVIYCKQEEPTHLYFFDWIELITRLFNLQINILKLFIAIFLRKTGDLYFLQKLSIALGGDLISIDTKDFYTCNNFSQIFTQANVILLYMYKLQYTYYENFAILILRNNQPDLFKIVEAKYLQLTTIQGIQQIFERVVINNTRNQLQAK